MHSIDHHCTLCQAWQVCAFQTFSKDELAELFRSKNCFSFKKHQRIFSAESKPLGIYCIKSGKVKLTNSGSQPDIEQILNIAKPGEIIGLDVALTDQPFHYNAETIEDSEVCLISKETFEKLMKESFLLTNEILKRAFISLKSRDAIISRLTQYSVRERTAQTLLSLIAEHGVRSKAGIKLDVHLTRKEIGQYSGTVQESVIRVLSDFKQEGLIALKKSQITVINLEGLEKVFRTPKAN